MKLKSAQYCKECDEVFEIKESDKDMTVFVMNACPDCGSMTFLPLQLIVKRDN